MTLDSMHLKNIRAHEDTKVVLERVNWLCGGSGDGKSTILQSLQLLLTARCDWTDGNGKGSANMITWGGPHGSVTAVIDGFGYSVNLPITDDEKKFVNTMLRQLHLQKDIIEACLVARHFFDLPDKEQKDILFRCTGEVLNNDTYLRCLEKWDAKGIVGEHLAAFWGAVEYSGDPYDTAFSFRAKAKKDLKQIEAEMRATAVGNEPPSVDEAGRQQLVERRQFLVAEIARLEERQRGAAINHESLVREWEAINQHHQGLRSEYDSLCKRQAALVAPKPSPVSLQDAQAALQAAQDLLQRTDTEKHAVSEQMFALASSKTCSTGVCAKTELTKLQKEFKVADKAFLDATKGREAAQNRVNAAKTHEHTVADYQRNAAELAERLAAVKERVALLPELPAKPVFSPSERPDIVAYSKELHEIGNRLQHIVAVEHDHQEWAAKRDRYIALMGELEQQKLEVKYWEALVDAFGPSGIQHRVLCKILGEITGEVNTLASQYFGMTFSIEPATWSVQAKRPGGLGAVPVKQLSHSERSRLSICLQVVLARMTGFNLVCIDEHGLDPSLRPALMRFLVAQTDIQSIVTSLLNKLDAGGKLVPPDAPNIPGLAIFHVEAGTVRRVVPKAEQPSQVSGPQSQPSLAAGRAS